MEIKKLTLKNYRAFEDATINFNDRLSVIVGNNSAGKSSVLDALALSLGTFLFGFDGVNAGGGNRISAEDVRIVEQKVGSNFDMQPVFPCSVKAEGAIAGNNVSWTRELLKKTGRTTTANAHEAISVAKVLENRLLDNDSNGTVLPVISYYGTGRLWAKKRDSKDKKSRMVNRQSGYMDCLSNETNEYLMNNWLLNMNLNAFSRKEELPELTAVYSAVKKCFESVIERDGITVDFDSNAMRLQIGYTDPSGKHAVFPMSSLSDGYKNTISMIADIASRMAMLNPQLGDDILSTPGVVLIDEVDLHLHPRWQERILGDLLRIFPNVQFIVSTHSPIVINSVRKENLIILNDEHAVEEAPYEVYGMEASQVLRNIMESNSRPLRITELFASFYKAMALERFDDAGEALSILSSLIGEDNPEYREAETFFDLEKN